MERLFSLLGVSFVILITWILSESPRSVRWKSIFIGLGLQALVVALMLGISGLTPVAPLSGVFHWLDQSFFYALDAARTGTDFLFGEHAGSSDSPFGFAFIALPPIVFVSAVTAVLYHFGILQRVVRGASWIMSKTLRTSGAESTAAASNIFFGRIESSFFIRPYLSSLTRSELFAILVVGLSTLSSGVMAVYVGLLNPLMPGIAGHFFTANVVSAIGGLLLAKISIPETQETKTRYTPTPTPALDRRRRSVFVSIVNGTIEGVQLAILVGGLLLVFVGFIHICDSALKIFSQFATAHSSWQVNISLSRIFGWIFKPLTWLVGIPWNESTIIGGLLGKKIVLNEFVSFLDLRAQWPLLSERSRLISIYILASSANFSSVAISVAGIGTLAPDKKLESANLGPRALLVAVLSVLLTASLVGIFTA